MNASTHDNLGLFHSLVAAKYLTIFIQRNTNSYNFLLFDQFLSRGLSSLITQISSCRIGSSLITGGLLKYYT